MIPTTPEGRRTLAFDCIRAEMRTGESWWECAKRLGVEEAIIRSGGQQDDAAAMLHTTPTTLWRCLRGYRYRKQSYPAIVDVDKLPHDRFGASGARR